jgi:glycosyltransferase involved in cell wall biosynthesis
VIQPLPVRPENANALGYVCTTPEEGLAQLEVLKQLGCKPHHRVLEIGCGALVAGFPVMQYLDPERYAGIDPNGWLTEASMMLPDVAVVLREKNPRFFQSSNFCAETDQKFDFILSHSILSHASSAQLDDFFVAAAKQLTPGGVLAASLRLADGNEFGSPGSAQRGTDFTEWQYPGVSWFAETDVLDRARRAGFSAVIDRELTRTILRGNPKAIHDWLHARRVAARRIFLGVPCLAEDQDTLVRALRSFAESDVEVVAIDNGATPAVKAALAEVTDIRVIHNPTNVYVNPAWNQLARMFLESAADVLVLANADLVAGPGWSQSLLARLEHTKKREWWVGVGVATEADVTRTATISAQSTDNPTHTAGAFFALPREAVAIAFPIPEELRIWYGDTWIQTALTAAGFTMTTLKGVVAWHAGKVSSNQVPELAGVVAHEKIMWESRLRARSEQVGREATEGRSPKTDSPLTLVTAFFRLRDRVVDEDEAFRQFGKLASCGMPIILFLDRKLADRAPNYPNVRIELTDLESLWPFGRKEKSLPPVTGTPGKDTRDFLLLQNAKLDLLALAKKLDSSTHFAWIDFGVMKITKDPTSFMTRLRELRPPPSCVLAPGCWNKAPRPAEIVNWRFCGGFLLVDRESIPALVERYHDVFRRMKRLTWEVNVWAEMELRGQRFDWYEADHDDSLIGAVATRGKRICLCMIVKNESAIIERCLTAALPFIDTWAIADTGSTDGTPELIEKFFSKHSVSGKITRTTFQNFAQARNEALAAARALGGWSYTLFIDADMMLKGSIDKTDLHATAYRVQQTTGNLAYWNTRLVRHDVAASYVGVTHEFLSVPGNQPPNLESVTIDDRNDGGSKGDKGERDIRLLNDGLVTEPANGRYMFYLANTYREAGRHAEAIQWYTRRIQAGGWDEEVWASYYGIARSRYLLGEEAAFVVACFDAYNYRPMRAESLSLLARYWREHGKSDSSLLIAEQVARMPCPGDILFIEQDIYERKNANDVAISGYYSKLPERRQTGYETCARLTIDRDPNVRGEARNNFLFYVKSASELGAKICAIDWKPTDGYAPMNPSVLVHDGRRLILVRTVNYKVSDGQYPTIDNSNIIKTKNWVVEFDESWRSTRATFVVDSTNLPRTNYPVEGFEDCRLYVDNGNLCASATVRDLGDGRCEMAMLRFDTEWRVVNIRVVRDYESDRTQKNWMPVLGHPSRFLYLCDPTITIDCTPERTVERSRIADLDQNLTEFRGGSQVIPYQNGWICLVHEVLFNPQRIYLHRFVRLNAEYVIQAVSEPFFFAQKGIEFAAGLAWNGGTLVASFGVNDASAHLAFFEPAIVDKLVG